MEDATIYDVARLAGVSISTVSLAINHPGRVRPATRERVHQAADAVGFVPKEHAVARARRGLGRIAVVAPFSHYPSYYRRLNGVFSELKDTATQVLIYDYADMATLESPLLSALPIRGHVDGLLIMGIPLSEAVADRLGGRLPTVLVDASHPGFPSVTVDYAGAGIEVALHLQSLGHRKVATLMGAAVSIPEGSPGWTRLSTFQDVYGLENVLRVIVDRRSGGGAEAVEAVLRNGPDGPDRPTAVFAEWDLLAVRFLAAARQTGIRVPEDISLVGFDDGDLPEALGLSTVTQPMEETGALGMRLLARALDGDDSPGSVQLTPALALRSTTGPAGGPQA
ncbi:MAG: LacI family transcriptional regulator [Propionibacteriaceae bacterium]|jgi:LacI family transcriptional regulator|nr:LacI family transcriptional regulator [Propionibacteriaceae bacterium]